MDTYYQFFFKDSIKFKILFNKPIEITFDIFIFILLISTVSQ